MGKGENTGENTGINTGTAGRLIVPGGGADEPAVYDRFITFDSGTLDQTTFGLAGGDGYDAGVEPNESLGANEQTFNGSVLASKHLGFSGLERMGGAPKIRNVKTPWPLGTEIWLQFRIWFGNDFLNAGGADAGTGNKWSRWKGVGNDLNSFYVSPNSGAPGETTMRYVSFGVGPDGNRNRAYVFSAPTAVQNGRVQANAWNTYEYYMKVGNTPSTGAVRVWKDYQPCTGYEWYAGSGITTEYTPIPGYEFPAITIRNAGDSMDGEIGMFGQWNGNPNGSGMANNITLWADAYAILVSKPGENRTPAKVDPISGFPYFGNWESG